MKEKLPPHDSPAEAGILGSILLSPADCMAECLEKIKAGHQVFYDLRNATLYRLFCYLTANQIPIDMVTIFKNLKRFKECRGITNAYVAGLPDAVPSAANLEYYIEIVLEKYLLRKIIQTGTELAKRAEDYEGKLDIFIDSMERDILAIRQSVEKTNGIADLMATHAELIQDYERAIESEDHAGFKTGFKELDQIIGGITGPELIVVAGQQSSGKTTLVMNILTSLARASTIVGVISLETTAKKLLHRILSAMAGINGHRLMTGNPNLGDWEKIKVASEELARIRNNILIDDSTGLNIMQVQSKIRRMSQMGAQIFAIDFMQLISSDGDNGTERMTNVSRGIKSVGKELNKPIIAISTITKESMKAERPIRMSDLFNSNAIQYDCTMAWLLNIKDDKKKDDTVTVNLEVGKNKEGTQAAINLSFYKPAFLFLNFQRIDPEDIPVRKTDD